MRKLNTPGVWRHVHYRRWQPTTAGDAVVTATITALDKMPNLLVASWTVKIAPVLESSFSGFLQDLIRLKK